MDNFFLAVLVATLWGIESMNKYGNALAEAYDDLRDRSYELNSLFKRGAIAGFHFGFAWAVVLGLFFLWFGHLCGS